MIRIKVFFNGKVIGSESYQERSNRQRVAALKRVEYLQQTFPLFGVTALSDKIAKKKGRS